MELRIKSRSGDLYEFSQVRENGYVWVVINASPRRQICSTGGFVGETLTATPETFNKTCRNWYRKHRRTD